MSNTTIVQSKSEIGAGTYGASIGVEALKLAALNQGNGYFKDRNIIEIINHNSSLFSSSSIDTPHAKNIDKLIDIYQDFCHKFKKVYDTGNIPIVLAGDHSSAGGTIAGIKHSFPQKRLGVIWVDAHADLHSPYTSPTGNMHGMPLAVSLGIDNKANQKNNVSNDAVDYWKKLKNISEINPKIDSRDVVLIGVRDTEKEEDLLIHELNMKTFVVEEVRQSNPKKIANETLKYLENCDIIYVSFDVDSMDCDLISHGTGTPVCNGFSEKESTELLIELCKSTKLCCFEITEINPLLDKKNTMAETGFRILEKVSQIIEEKLDL